jgi:hypothetical protein
MSGDRDEHIDEALAAAAGILVVFVAVLDPLASALAAVALLAVLIAYRAHRGRGHRLT